VSEFTPMYGVISDTAVESTSKTLPVGDAGPRYAVSISTRGLLIRAGRTISP